MAKIMNQLKHNMINEKIAFLAFLASCAMRYAFC
jgi:hypothetical protein